jgi:hypothetical protein
MVGTILAEADSATEDEKLGKGNSAVKIDLSLRQGRSPHQWGGRPCPPALDRDQRAKKGKTLAIGQANSSRRFMG